jgi:hypothetical protein
MSIKLGRVFRRMGLPAWTFLGVGISAIWFTYIGTLIEMLLRDGLKKIGLDVSVHHRIAYVPPTVVFLIPFIVVLFAWTWQSAKYGISKLRLTGTGLPQPDGKKGLMLLVSKPDSAMFAIEYHLATKGVLEKVWLIPSNDVEIEKFGHSSMPIAETIRQRCLDLAVSLGRRVLVEVHNTGVSPADAQDTFDYVNRIFRQSGYEPSELIADFTGGTKPMSVGMIMACLPTERQLEYVSLNAQSKQSFGPFLIDYQHAAFDLVG